MNRQDNPQLHTTGFSARQCAVQLLADILERKRTLEEAIAHHNRFGSLSERDRNFTRLLVLTCLRRLGQIDTLLAQFLQSPLQGKTQDVQHCLRLGVTQLLWIGTPAHAAVNESVDAVAALGHARMKGVVNAVLKRVATEGAAIIATQDEAKLNTPKWLFESWRKTIGEKAARAIALARLQEVPLDITVKSSPQEWADKLEAKLLPTGSVRLMQAGRIDQLQGFAEGEWWVQDAAAALPVKLLGEIKGQTVFDLCAAPGGKTAQLAAAGANVLAVDQSARRLERLTDNLNRLGLKAEVTTADLLKWKAPCLADAILLDAPCSATGTLRRHPELVWQRSAEDLTRLVDIQKRLLHRAAGWLKPGGKLVYCVCSLQPEEGEEQVQSFLNRHPEFIRKPAEAIPSEFISKSGAYVTHPGLWPELGGVDGFYAALLVKPTV